ncbi:hypothetical protein BX666DRAFT_1853445 [Dichotomocladium elegans]|nr:hypothetical protein BX666DRAFT_1853445 [Dichotomocladium elegans]
MTVPYRQVYPLSSSADERADCHVKDYHDASLIPVRTHHRPLSLSRLSSRWSRGGNRPNSAPLASSPAPPSPRSYRSVSPLHRTGSSRYQIETGGYGANTRPQTPLSQKSVSGILSYPALLSYIANELRHRIVLTDCQKDGIEYKSSFDGQEAVDKLLLITQSRDRHLAVRVGRALESQRLFHDVNYERRLVDSVSGLYQFDDQLSTNDLAFSAPLTDGFPCGVYTELTHCYSPTCAFDHEPCYSYFCPKRTLRREQSNSYVGSTATSGDRRSSSLDAFRREVFWVDTVDSTVRESISRSEWKRQEAIFELIHTEANFVRILQYMWIEPILENADVLFANDLERCDQFVRDVFDNIRSICDGHVQFLAALQARQREQSIVTQIGDVMMEYVDYFDPFIQYSASRYKAKFVFEQERMKNSAFAEFVMVTMRHPSSQRLPLFGYLQQPTTRLGRYNLLLNGILKETPDNHPDREIIPKIIKMIEIILTQMNIKTGEAKNRYDLERIQANLQFKNPLDHVDLDLGNKDRRIIKEDKLYKSPNNLSSTEFQVILLDNYLLVARVKLEKGLQQFVIQRPVGLGTQMPLRPVMEYPYPSDNNNNTLIGPIGTKNQTFPITFQHLGRHGSGSFTLYAASKPAQKPLLEKIKALQDYRNNSRVALKMITAVKEHEIFVTNKSNHMVTFNNGRQYVLATNDGVYVGHMERSSPPRRVLALERVTQVEVLEGAQKLLVLADRTLWEYALHVVNTQGGRTGSGANSEKRRQIQSSVPFFHVGECLDKTLLCIPKGNFSTRIIVYEPQRLEDYSKHRKRHNRLPPTPHPLDLPMKKFAECSVPTEVWNIELSKYKMFVTTSYGVSILDMRDVRNIMPQNLLNSKDPQLSFVSSRERDHQIRSIQKRINIFRTPDSQHVVCYDEFAFYIDNQGNRARPEFLIEWEGHPEAYGFCYPYLIAFEPNFIEIREIHKVRWRQPSDDVKSFALSFSH